MSKQLRTIIDPVIVRRSRIDLKEIKEYADDLKIQGIQFPEVVGPELVEYDLAEIRGLYIKTLEQLSNDFICARYNPAAYLIDPQGFMDKYGELFDETDIRQFQRNLAQFIQRLLVMRFESSKSAFKSTLENILTSYENIKKWWAKGYVPIKKHGYLPDPDEDEIEETLKEINDLSNEEIDVTKIKKKAIPFERSLFKEEYLDAIESDIRLLTKIKKAWFGSEDIGFDPKYNEVKATIAKLLAQRPERKIVIFSSYADTANYVHEKLDADGFRTLLYTGGAAKIDRAVVRQNFDASCRPEEQKNDYDIIVATDALSEGFNLNRAGVIINYDIPYNPTRVVQRIGRINRINKKMFDEIFIYNFFPTDIGERSTLIKGISTLKMLLINNIVGSDTKTLTPNETLQSYFKRQFDEADTSSAEKSWDNEYRNIYNAVKHNTTLYDEIMQIPERARIVRKNCNKVCAISFAKRGNNSLFAIAEPFATKARIVSPEDVLGLFKADMDEKSYEFDVDLDKKFSILRDELQKPYPKVKLDKRRANAIENIKKLLSVYPAEKDYLKDLLDVISTYDDLSDGELRYLAKLSIRQNNIKDIIDELKQRIPAHYIIQIKEKAESIDAQTEIIMFTEDLRDDNN